MDYQVHPSSPRLQPFIKCFWTLENDAQAEAFPQRIVPDGCMEMIFHYGDPYRQYFEDGSFIIQPRSFIFGQITTFLAIAPVGRTGTISARFAPEGLAPFLGTVPVASLENRAVSLEELFGNEGKLLEHEVIHAKGTRERIGHIETFLLSRLTRPEAIDTVIRSCVEVILRSGGQLGIMDLADKMNINRRSLERRFQAVTGMSPKHLSRIVRLQAALNMLEQKKFSTLTSLAHENGYYDQAHFVKDFREFTGVSPKSFFAGNLELSALFIASE